MHPQHALFFQYHRLQHCQRTLLSALPQKSSTQTFSLFPLLPAELRLKIWQMIAREPQSIEISCLFVSSNQHTSGQWFTHTPPPIIFSICSESRAAGFFEFERLEFGKGQIGRDWGTVYVNWERDCIWLCNDLSSIWARDFLGKNEQARRKLKRLSVGKNLWKALNPMMGLEQAQLRGMKSYATNVVDNLRALESIEFHS